MNPTHMQCLNAMLSVSFIVLWLGFGLGWLSRGEHDKDKSNTQ
jgi:hypothetical protein